MKTIEERALAYSEQVVNDTPFDVINGKVCVWQEDKDICEVARQAYIAGALEQRDIEIEAAEERAKEYSLKDFDGFYTGRENVVEEGYIAGAREQKQLTLEAFDEWLCRNSWITRDENNRQPLAELRDIIENI